MPCIAQKLGPAMCLRADLVRDRLTIQLPRAAVLRRVREVLQRRAEGLGFLSEDPCYRPRYLNIQRLNYLWTIRHSSARIAGNLIT